MVANAESWLVVGGRCGADKGSSRYRVYGRSPIGALSCGVRQRPSLPAARRDARCLLGQPGTPTGPRAPVPPAHHHPRSPADPAQPADAAGRQPRTTCCPHSTIQPSPLIRWLRLIGRGPRGHWGARGCWLVRGRGGGNRFRSRRLLTTKAQSGRRFRRGRLTGQGIRLRIRWFGVVGHGGLPVAVLMILQCGMVCGCRRRCWASLSS